MATHQSRVSAMRGETDLRVALVLRDAGHADVSALARATGLSRPTVDAALARLAERGLVIEWRSTLPEGDHARAGRPSRTYGFVADAAYVAGVDVGADSVLVVLADLSGVVVARSERVGLGELDRTARVDLIADLTRAALRKAGASQESLRHIVVAVSGVVGTDGRIVASEAHREWQGLDIAGRVAAVLGTRVSLDNDVKLAALAEHRLGAARLAKDALFVNLGRKISMGMVLDGALRRGRHNGAGELSRMNLRLPLDENDDMRWTTAQDGLTVLRNAAAGDADAVAERGAFVEGLSELIALFAQGLDPDCVVIGGSLVQAGDALLGPLRDAVRRRSSLPFDWPLLPSALGPEIVALGALSRAFEISSRAVYGKDGVPAPLITTTHDRGGTVDGGG